MKTDLSKLKKDYYTAGAKPKILHIDKTRYLSVSGKGDPSGKEYADVLQGLYSTAYTLKFMYKAMDKDFTIAKLEGLWSFDEEKYGHVSMTEAPTQIPREEWSYRMLIMLPDFVKAEHIQESVESVLNKKQILTARHVELFELNEGKVVQMLHKGPFSTEVETLLLMRAFMEEQGFKRNGLHHEIYLSDFRKTDPAKLRTILREPVK